MYAVCGLVVGRTSALAGCSDYSRPRSAAGACTLNLVSRCTGLLTLGIEDAALIFDGEAEKIGTRGAALRGQPFLLSRQGQYEDEGKAARVNNNN